MATPRNLLKYFRKIGVKKCLLLLINFIFYRLEFKTLKGGKQGWFLVKRKWVWFVMTPVFLPLFLLFALAVGIFEYFTMIFNFIHHWIERDSKPLTIGEKIIYRQQLWSDRI